MVVEDMYFSASCGFSMAAETPTAPMSKSAPMDSLKTALRWAADVHDPLDTPEPACATPPFSHTNEFHSHANEKGWHANEFHWRSNRNHWRAEVGGACAHRRHGCVTGGHWRVIRWHSPTNGPHGCANPRHWRMEFKRPCASPAHGRTNLARWRASTSDWRAGRDRWRMDFHPWRRHRRDARATARWSARVAAM